MSCFTKTPMLYLKPQQYQKKYDSRPPRQGLITADINGFLSSVFLRTCSKITINRKLV